MNKKYDSFIELTPGYESVVDISSDSSDREFWSRYIVNEDMVTAVRLLARSLRPDNPNEDVWHYWIKGAYGTGKTYSAIVIKHLLEDDYSVVENFLNKNKLFIDVKDKFLAARKDARYYVKFRSGECKQLVTSNKFLLQIEQSVREVLKENGFSYTGRNSLIDSVKKAVKDFRATLAQKFDMEEYPEYWGIYDNFDSFYDEVQVGDITACSNAQEILQSLNIGLATDLDTFKEWLKDIYAGNEELSKSGIFIIWDEFTEYIRNNDLDIIQQLSMLSKEIPFFIIYVMHEYPGLFTDSVSGSLGKADARFHKIEVSLSKKTTIKLIGESIITKDGMHDNWADICDYLYSTIKGSAHLYMGGPDSDMDANTLKSIFPIHPMTVYMVSMVAGMSASNRSIFEFLKSSGRDGFRAYIHDNGRYDWKWVTPDYLWDYFFVNNLGGKKTITAAAEETLKHYNKYKDLISDEKALRVFKVAMLLLATVGTSQRLKKSRASKGIQATEETLCECFSGMMDQDLIKSYLQALSADPLNALVLAPDIHGELRIELPYSGTSGELGAEIEKIKGDYSHAKLLYSDNEFGSVLKKQFVPAVKAVVKRLVVDTCFGVTQQLNYKYGELKDTIGKTYYKFGLMIVAVPSAEEIDKIKNTVKGLLAEDDTHRVMVAIMRHPLDDETFDNWYEVMANSILAQKSGNNVNASAYKTQAAELVGTWVSTAIGKDMDLLYGDTPAHLYTNNNVMANYEKIVFNMFPAAPESFIKKITLYKSASILPAYYGASKTTLENKDASNENQRKFNQQWQDCVDVLRDNNENVWDCNAVEDIINMSETKVGRSMSALMSFIGKTLATGSVYLTDLWDDMQKELGYYNTSICCYLIGFAFHFYIGQFTWYDGNNGHKLDEDTIPTMVVNMVTGKSAGMKLSSESNTEKRFKDITQRIFGLTQEEIGDVYDCRKNVKIHITKIGYPFWALKYLDENDYSGVKTEVSEIVDKYVEYILEVGSQPDVMEDIVNLVKVNPKAYVNVLSELFKDKSKLAYGMKEFVFTGSPDARNTCEKYMFSVNTLFNMLSRTLEEERWQWREDEVTKVTAKLVLDLKLVGVVNSALDGQAESVEKVKTTLANYLDYIRIPGFVYEELPDEWSKSVGMLHNIAIGKWIGYSESEKLDSISELELHAKEAFNNIAHPVAVLKFYIESRDMGRFSDIEYNDILLSLQNESYSQTEQNFQTAIRNKINELDYTKKVNSVLEVWHSKTDTKNILEWTMKYKMPIVWVIPEQEAVCLAISAISNNERIDVNKLENVLSIIEKADLQPLNNSDTINKSFIVNVSSEKYYHLLLPHVDELKSKIQNSGYMDYLSWNKELVQIRKITEEFIKNDLRDEVSGSAKKKASQMSEDQLRSQLTRLLNSSPEACLFILNEA